MYQAVNSLEINRGGRRHAFLIMCHNQFTLLGKLLDILDEDWIDIYIHIDKRANPPVDIGKNLRHANLYLIPRIKVNWGGYSQIKVELMLLQEAVRTPHQYYHLISGVDFPVKTMADIRRFFDKYDGMQYIRYNKDAYENKDFLHRIKYYYFFQDGIGRNSGAHIAFLEKLEKFSLGIQKIFRVNRIKGKENIYFKGSNWFSITHELAQWIVGQNTKIRRMFRYTHCADEIVLQTVAMMSPYSEMIAYDNMRLIDWSRGNPYTFTADDFEELMQGDRLFARKFDYDNEPKIVDMLEQHLKL